jgi:hypothetical protein
MKNFQNKQKIVKVSKVLRNIAFAGLVLWVLMIPASLLAAVGMAAYVKPSLSATEFLMVPMFVLAFLTNLKIFRFFDRLQKGFFFDAQTVGNLNAAANWWLVLWFWDMMFFVLMRQPWNNPHDFSLVHFLPDTGGLLAPLTLKFVAWFFREAQDLQEEQELTV